MKCEFCGSFPRDAGAVECPACGEPLPPAVRVEYLVAETLRPGVPGTIRVRLSNEGTEISDLHLELRSSLLTRPGRAHVAKLPAYPHDRSVCDDIVVPVEATGAGCTPLEVMLAFRRGPGRPLSAYTGTGEVAVRAAAASHQVNIRAEKIYATDIQTGEVETREWHRVAMLYDEGASRRVLARSVHQARIVCPYCRHLLERRFECCPECGIEVPAYLPAARAFQPPSAVWRRAMEGLTLTCMNTGLQLCLRWKPRLSMGRKPEWNDVLLLVLPRNTVNDASSARISRDHCWLRVDGEQPVLQFKNPVQLGDEVTEEVLLESEGRFPIADVMALDIKPFFLEGPVSRYHLATRVTPMNAGSSKGARPIVHHLLLQRWINVSVEETGAPRLSTSSDGALCRIVRHEQAFWIEALDEARPIIIDDGVVPTGEIAPLAPGRRLGCGRLAFVVGRNGSSDGVQAAAP